jgi:hypothetical protein
MVMDYAASIFFAFGGKPAPFVLLLDDGSEGIETLRSDLTGHVLTAIRSGKSRRVLSRATGEIYIFSPDKPEHHYPEKVAQVVQTIR